MVVRVDISPELLRWAVERAGWDDATVESRAPKLSAWISGTVRPTLKQVQKFAAATHTPFGQLFLPEPPVESVPIPDMRTMGNAEVPHPSANLLDTIYLCQARQEWYRDFAHDYGLPDKEFVGSATTATPPEQVAQQITDLLDFDLPQRSEFASWSQAFRGLIDRIEDIGVLVMVNGIVGSNTHRPLNPEEFRGFALSDPQAPLIFVNAADTKAAQIFTLIHELAHVWLGGSALSDASMMARSGVAEELWCNDVAAEVLVPRAALRTEYAGTVTADELHRLAATYRVSTLVVLTRLHDVGLLSWEDFRSCFSAESDRLTTILNEQRVKGSGGNFYYTQPLRLSRLFARAVLTSTAEGATTYRDAFHLLGIKKHETIEKLAMELGVA